MLAGAIRQSNLSADSPSAPSLRSTPVAAPRLVEREGEPKTSG
ncbi:hypothetical protein RISK_002281 [Rhodopirellula islandica]|uniref:Uncharacterized protein n=1 Tax=Rhodopirellula islandica TaxID=595434 RepID=A0A0J1EJF3_RHOIS|nr:hypothetical protein RISK_002281 [Rhodopirellula islandica]